MRAHRRQDISIGFGKIYNSPCQGAKGLLVALQAITDCLSIFCFFWILRTGAPWRDLPPKYGDWKNIHRRFCRRRERGGWVHLLEAIIVDQDMSRTRGLNSKIHLAVDAHGMPLRAIITEGTRADCKEACAVIDAFDTKAILVDRVFDINNVVKEANKDV